MARGGGGGSQGDHQAQGVTALLGAETGRISPAALCGLPQPGGSLRERDGEEEYRGESQLNVKD